MTQIPILNGIYTDDAADFRTSYPINMVPVPKQQGLSAGYLRPSDGIVELGTGPGIDRGGINWNGVCYRVMGTKLVSISESGVTTTIGDVGGSGQVTFDYSFDYLGIASSGKLYLYNGISLAQNTDPDLGNVVDFIWIDGYFMTTDGTSIIVTELTDPFSVNPLKYGSSEVDPDSIKALKKIKDEAYAVNRYTIEVFDNIGGDFFPFQRIDGAQIDKGSIGTHSVCIYEDALVFIGSGRNEAPSVYLATGGQAPKISTREIDQLLESYSETQLSNSVLEVRGNKGHSHLWIRLPDRTIVYDYAASKVLEKPVWHTLISSLEGFQKYRAQNLVWCYDKWLCGDPFSSSHGYLTDKISTQYGNDARWEFGTIIIYNQSNSAIMHQLELVSLPGRIALGSEPTISTSYSVDGVNWSQEKYKSIGKIGDRTKRIVWLNQGWLRNWRIQRFRGDSQAFISFARLEATIEPLSV